MFCFADDQLPSLDQAENKRTRNEIRRELGTKLADPDAAFDANFHWFQGLPNYFNYRGQSFNEVGSKIESLHDFDIAVIDLSWWGDNKLPHGPHHQDNVGTQLIRRLAEIGRDRGLKIPVIAYSRNFNNFELMSDVLDEGALPVPKSYDDIGYRALYSAIRHLARIDEVGEHHDAAKGASTFSSAMPTRIQTLPSGW